MTTVLWLLQMQAALADPGESGALGQTPPALSWIELNDTHGISIWNFEMSLDRGGITDPGKFFWSSIVDSYWGSYRSGCALALWFLDWVMSFEWLHIVASPLLSTGDAMQAVVTRIGVVPTLLTITAVVAVGWMARGRYATGIWELAMALLIATLATGVFAQPVHLIAGDNGLIMKAQQAGLELAGELATGQNGDSLSPDQLRKQMIGQMVDTFVRQPAQMINFGRVLDGGKCEKAYNDVVRDGPYGLEDDIRDEVDSCDSDLGDYANEPSAGMATGAFMFEPASAIILIFVVVLAGSVIAAAVYAMFLALKTIVVLVTGLLPGGARGSLFMTIAETAIALLIIVFTNVFLGVFLMVIQELFRDATGSSIPKTFVIFDVLLIVGIGVFWRFKKRLKESAQRLAQWMSQRPGGQATRLPERMGGGLGSWAGKALSTASQLSMIQSRRASRAGAGGVYNIDARRQSVGFFGFGPGGDGDGPVWVQSPPPDDGGGPTQPATPLPGTPGGSPPLARIEARKAAAGRTLTGALARAGTKAVLASATGGASTALTGVAKATKALTTARRARVISQLALPPGPSAPPTPPASTGPTPTPTGRPGPARPLPATPSRPALPAGPRQRPTPDKSSGAPPPSPSTPTPAATAASSKAAEPGSRPSPVASRSPSVPGRTSPGTAAPAQPVTRPVAPQPTKGGAGMRRQWDKVVRDGQVILVSRTTPAPAGPAAENEPPAIQRTRPPHRNR
ncbi:hypothetical protein GCM10009616_34420 [Microlunatus lacustris]